jgi:hypothetical protein
MAVRWNFILALVLVLVMISAPYWVAFHSGNPEYHFGGFLINPTDGYSYLAKMQQGFEGSWRFVLPYTAEPGDGAYLFVFYLALGHLARWLGWPLLLVYHLARIAGAIFLIAVLNEFFKQVFKEETYAKAGLWIAVLGSGLGWLAALAGLFASDFWVAEAYPFLSMYTNPHFTIGLGLLVLSLAPRKRSLPVKFILGVSLAAIQPFAAVIASLVMAAHFAIRAWDNFRHKQGWKGNLKDMTGVAFFLFGTGSVLVYQYTSILADPVLKEWNLQNQTPSPSLIDVLVSFSPALLAGLLGLKTAWKEKSGQTLVLWAGICLLLMAVPWNLQRRFITGLYLPLAGLAVYGLEELKDKTGVNFRAALAIFLVLSVPTNFLVITSGLTAAVRHDDRIYLTDELVAALSWIDKNTMPSDLILADPATGLVVPAMTGRKVIYGHPFETAQAGKELNFVEEFYSGELINAKTWEELQARSVRFVLLNADASEVLREWVASECGPPIYTNPQMAIFQLTQHD